MVVIVDGSVAHVRHGDIPLLGETGGDDRNAAEPPFFRENLPERVPKK